MCSILQGALEACNSLRDAVGLYESDVFNFESDYDTVDKSIQSSRHVDVFKVWLMWRAKGPQGYEAQIEQLMDLSRYDSDVTVICDCVSRYYCFMVAALEPANSFDPIMRPDSLLRLWRCIIINHLHTYLLSYLLIYLA